MNFDFKTEKKENSQMLLTLTFPKEEIKAKYDEKLKEIQKEIIIKGFRKGKAPISLIEAKYKDAILTELSADILEDAFRDVYDKLEKKPLSTSIPTLKEFKAMELDKDYSVDLIYDIYPEFEYEDYNKIEIEEDEIVISKEDIEKEIQNRLRNVATVEIKEGPIEKGDIAYVNYIIKENGKEVNKEEGRHIFISDNNSDEIGGELIKLKKGDKKVIKKTIDTDKDNKKEVEIEVEILEVKKEVIPELTDEIAKEIDKTCNNVKELREKIEQSIKDYIKEYTKRKNIDKVFKMLGESYKGEIPESLVQYNLDSTYNQLLEKVKGNEKALQNILKIKNKEEYKEKSREKSIEKIKISFILESIMKKENIEVTDDEIKEYLKEYYKTPVENDKFFNFLKQSNNLDSIKDIIKEKKVGDKI